MVDQEKWLRLFRRSGLNLLALLLTLAYAQAAPVGQLQRGELKVSLEVTQPGWGGQTRAGRLTFQRANAAPISVETKGLNGARLGEFSPDGRWLTVLSWLGYAQLWDAQKGTRKATFLAHDHLSNEARRAVFSPDSRRVVLYAYPHELSLWDTASGARVRLLTPYAPMWNLGDGDVKFSPDGKTFLVTGGGAPARLFETEHGALEQVFDQPRDEFGRPRGSLAGTFSQDGQQLAVLYGGGEARLYSLTQGRALSKTVWATGPFSTLESGKRYWLGPLSLIGRKLSGQSLNGWTFTAKF